MILDVQSNAEQGQLGADAPHAGGCNSAHDLRASDKRVERPGDSQQLAAQFALVLEPSDHGEEFMLFATADGRRQTALILRLLVLNPPLLSSGI